MKDTVIVVGSNGYVGRALKQRLLAEGRRVIGIQPNVRRDEPSSSRSEDFLLLSSGDAPWVAKQEFDHISAVINVAQHSGFTDFPNQSAAVLRTNVLLPLEIAAWCSRENVPTFIHFSSGGIYKRRNQTFLKEDDLLDNPTQLGFYLTTKLQSEQILTHFVNLSPGIAIVRPFFIYGPSMTSTRLIPRLFERIRAQAPIELKGENGPSINPCHVDDICDLVISLLEQRFAGAVNAAGAQSTNLRDLCIALSHFAGVPPIFHQHQDADSDCLGDTTLMEKILGRPPRGIFDQGSIDMFSLS